MDIEQQVEYLMQGTQYGDDTLKRNMAAELRERLVEAQQVGRPLRVYCGFDPRTSDLHLGHTVPMRKLRQFQELGHEVIFLVGNYTSLIGDPSDKDKLRPQLTAEEVAENSRTYAEQAYKVLDPGKTHIMYNAAWLSELSFADVIRLASNFTLQQFLTRENFAKRFEKNEAIFLHETFYALMQGYDAFALDCDVQVGGTDQLFNIVTAARKLMAALGKRPNIAVILDILPGTDGEVKMSKSLGNHIPLLSTPEDMYGKVMSLPDKAMPSFFRLVTSWKPEEIEAVEQALAGGELHPRDAKMKLAREIVSIYHGAYEAERAEAEFVRVYQMRQNPLEMPTTTYTDGMSVLEVLLATGAFESASEAKRMLKQNAVRLETGSQKGSAEPGEPVTVTLTNPFDRFPASGILQIGRRKFFKVERDSAAGGETQRTS